MKTTLLSIWKEKTTRARYPLIAGVLFVTVVEVLRRFQENGTGFIPSFLSYPR